MENNENINSILDNSDNNDLVENLDLYEKTNGNENVIESANTNLNVNSIADKQNDIGKHRAKKDKKFIVSKMLFAFRIIIPLVVAIFSFVIVSDYASSSEVHVSTIQSLQTKQETVLKISAASAGIAAGASLALGDRANAVANKLLDLTGYFIIILCAIIIEKYFVTMIGFMSFKIIIPFACAFYIIFTIIDKKMMRRLALKIFTFAIISFLIIPLSMGISKIIEDTYADANINQVLNESDALKQELDEERVDNNILSNQVEIENKNVLNDETRENISNNEISEKEQTNLIDNIASFFNGAQNKVSNTVSQAFGAISAKTTELIDKLTNQLNKMIETIAVMLVTTCAIPIIVIFFFLSLVKILFSIDISFDSKKIPRLSSFKR